MTDRRKLLMMPRGASWAVLDEHIHVVASGLSYETARRLVDEDMPACAICNTLESGFCREHTPDHAAKIGCAERDKESYDRIDMAELLQSATEELAVRAQRDDLTGLLSRRRFDEVLDREVRRSVRTRLPLALLLVDVDPVSRLMKIGRTAAGLVCLKLVASILQDRARRPADMAARFGDDELALLLPETEPAGAEVIAERTLCNVRQIACTHASPASELMRVSVGLATTSFTESSRTEYSGEELIQAAAAALIRAKASGGDLYAVRAL